MTIATVKAGSFKRNANIGLAIHSDVWYKEQYQIVDIAAELIRETKTMNYTDGVIFAYGVIEKSNNSKAIKNRIIKEYCKQKINAE